MRRIEGRWFMRPKCNTCKFMIMKDFKKKDKRFYHDPAEKFCTVYNQKVPQRGVEMPLWCNNKWELRE